MAAFKIQSLGAPFDRQWDSLVEKSCGGTIFHRLDFLDYHKDRFQKSQKPLVILKGTSLYGVMPFALFEQAGVRTAKSPYGGSFGGPVFSDVPTYNESRSIVEAFMKYCHEQNASEIVMTLPPLFYFRDGCETFAFCLLEHGFRVVNQDILHCLDLQQAGDLDAIMTSRARNMVKKARQYDLQLKSKAAIKDFWLLLTKHYQSLGKQPTHSQEEFQYLNKKFPDRVYTDIVYLKDQPIAGMGIIKANDRVAMSFYLATDPEFHHTQAQSLCIYEILSRFKQQGVRYFDFGTSSAGMKANPNLFLFKESFGARGFLKTTYAIEL